MDGGNEWILNKIERDNKKYPRNLRLGDISSRSSKSSRGDSPVGSPRSTKKLIGAASIDDRHPPPGSPKSPKPWRTPPTRVRRANSGETFQFSETRDSPDSPRRRFVFHPNKEPLSAVVGVNPTTMASSSITATSEQDEVHHSIYSNQQETPSPPQSSTPSPLPLQSSPPRQQPQSKPIVRLEPVIATPGHEETIENGGTCFDFGQNESRGLSVSSPISKSVSFHSGTSLPEERKISSAFDCLHFMMKGCSLLKVRASSRQYRRYFTLDEDLRSIRWVPSSKKSNKAKLPISQIREVRLGKTTDILRDKEIAGCYSEDCVFSVIYGDAYDSLDLVASTADEANFWVTGISMLMASSRQSVNMENIDERQLMREKWLQECFRQADTDRKGLLEESETIALAKKINSQLSTVRLRQKIQEFSIESGERTGRIDQHQFVLLFKDIATRPEVFFLMVRYSGKDYFAKDDFHFFLEGEQEMETREEDVIKYIEDFEPSSEARRDEQMLLDGFTLFLLSQHSSLMAKSRITHDMNQPLTHYFISSSYDTFEVEGETENAESVEGYVQALTQGCRCVKLDLSVTDGIFYVGKTLLLDEVLDTIRDFAFAGSKYPLIVHIDFNNLTHDNACQLARQLRNALGEHLHIPKAGDQSISNASPESLAQKIILYFPPGHSGSDQARARKTARDEEWDFSHSASELAALGALNQNIHVDFASLQNSQAENEVCFLKQTNALKLCHSLADEFVQHCKRYLTHVEPHKNPKRDEVRQVNPLELWAAGVQMASISFQETYAPMDIHRGWFSQNGRCGYVLKPSCLRQPWTVFNAFKKEIITIPNPCQQLPLPRGASVKASSIDPYVMLQIFGIPNDCAEARTKTVSNEGQNPIFDESFEFTITAPQLAVLRLTVLDDDYIGDDFIGQRSVPVSCLQPGYRHVTLLADSGHPLLNATLFVHVTMCSRSSNDKKLRRKRSWQTKMISAGSGIADLRPTGLKPIDETCKNGATLLTECAKLKAALDKAMIELCEECGLSTSSNLAQCLRVLVQRMASCNDISAFSINCSGSFPEIQAVGEPTAPKSAKCLQCFERVLQECTYVVQNSKQLSDGLKDLYKNIQLHATELPSLCSAHKSKKADKATENFIWNASFIESRIEAVASLTHECQTYINQITRLRGAAERIFHREKTLIQAANQPPTSAAATATAAAAGLHSSGCSQKQRTSSSLSITPPIQQSSAPCTPPPVSPGPDSSRPHAKKGILKKPSSPVQITQQDLATSL